MKRPSYIQRLNKPTNFINPFSFGGGGLVNGGLSEDGLKIIQDIFSFDYMGAAEFEWGAVPTALQSLAKLSIKNKLMTSILNDKIYVIAPKDIIEDVLAWIEDASKKDYGHNLKEYLGLKSALEDKSKFVGWLKIERDKDCEEPFMFFIDKDMYDNACKLFKLKN